MRSHRTVTTHIIYQLCCLIRAIKAEKASLLISLWRATTSGLLDTRTSAQAAGAIHAATLLNLHSSDDDEDEDEEYSK